MSSRTDSGQQDRILVGDDARPDFWGKEASRQARPCSRKSESVGTAHAAETRIELENWGVWKYRPTESGEVERAARKEKAELDRRGRPSHQADYGDLNCRGYEG